MSLAPLLSASPAIQVHALAAIAAFGLGLAMLARRKGGWAHRLLGRLWVGLMAATALSSFAISSHTAWGGWSPIHGLSALTLAALVYAVAMARAGRIRAHRTAMVSLFAGALVISGGFTLMPGRIMHAVIFGTSEGVHGPIAAAFAVVPLWGWILLAAAAFGTVRLGLARERGRPVGPRLTRRA
ncbi:DUF2306 domain-containing protein [Salinarimonas soli]|uniref:DUF2306 domain-containing protein n=1 Tax=Salinarimonas soli TaxID=1638099 RepID=A0A5B2VHS9_9HYPH|nr:DUF2306 domain-containing protein [Salinarimonas soli]KAA2237912.1 DUF2306 domain-containing protein [Salinarimonas soli]